MTGDRDPVTVHGEEIRYFDSPVDDDDPVRPVDVATALRIMRGNPGLSPAEVHALELAADLISPDVGGAE